MVFFLRKAIHSFVPQNSFVIFRVSLPLCVNVTHFIFRLCVSVCRFCFSFFCVDSFSVMFVSYSLLYNMCLILFVSVFFASLVMGYVRNLFNR
jgi:hypothetical protein